jgi:hypothetical protein
MYIPVKFGDGIKKDDTEFEPTTFKNLGLKERDIEEFLRLNINLVLGDEETLLVVGQQVRNEQSGVSDLTAIDSDGNIVLIEIKRDVEDVKGRREAFEFQAIRYAASYAKIKTPDDLVDLVYSSYIEHHKNEYELGELTSTEQATRLLNQFLVSNNALKTFNSKQRVMLIASSFDNQTLSAVAWLISNGVDISCFTITPIIAGEQYFLNIEKLLPPPDLDDFYVNLAKATTIAKVTRTATESGIKRTVLPRMGKLFEWDIIHSGDQIKIKNYDDSEAEVIDTNSVRFNGDVMSYNQWGQKVTGWSSINIYEWTVLIDQNRTLHELRMKKMDELENLESNDL